MADRCPAHFARILVGVALLLPLATQAQTESLYQVELLVFSYPAGGTEEQWEATPDLAYPATTRFLTMPGEQAGQVAPTHTPVPAQPTPFVTLPASQREFGSKADTMQRSGRYRILFHEAWLQPMTSQSGTLPIVLDHSGDGGQWPALQGTITLYLSGDVNLETNLWLNTQGEYLNSSWRMPPPPLGPVSSSARGAPLPSISGSRGTAATPESSGSAYPFRHAVLLQQVRRMRSGEVAYIDHPMLGVVAKITALGEVAPEASATPEAAPNPETTAPPTPGPATTPPA